MKVLHVLGPLRRSGAEQMLLASLGHFRAAGVELEVVSLADIRESDSGRSFEDAGVRVTYIGGRSRMTTIRGVWRALRTSRAECVHVHAEKLSALTAALSRVSGSSVVRTVHSTFQFEGSLRWRKRFERRFARWLGVQFIAISTSVQSNELTRFGNPTVTIMNWFDDQRFVIPSEAVRSSERRRFGANPETFVIALVGNCAPVKNHRLLFDALIKIAPTGEVLVLHAGNDHCSAEERAVASALPTHTSVQFLGSFDDVPSVLAASDLYVMPSLWEGMGIAALEAGASGLPTLLSDVEGLREIAQYLPSNHLAAPAVDPFAAALKALIEERPHRSTKADTEILRQVFGTARGVHEYLLAYSEAASKNGRTQHA